MSPRSTPEQLHRVLHGPLRALRGALWKTDQPIVQRHRDELPEMSEKIDEVIGLLGERMRHSRSTRSDDDNNLR